MLSSILIHAEMTGPFKGRMRERRTASWGAQLESRKRKSTRDWSVYMQLGQPCLLAGNYLRIPTFYRDWETEALSSGAG